MHKITKGLKKKKKGKKSKRGEEDLFKPEELENYRREHQGTSDEPAAQNEEWRKFIALTSEVDDILKKTQGDLNRIKSTSFFQRKPTESEVRKVEEQHQKEVDEQRRVEEHKREEPPKPTGIVEVSESESEEEDDDTVFDTAYIDAIATGEVKLAYIPESPTEQQDDDPFDTSYAERAILGPEGQRKGRKLVPLGAAVEVLTGRVQLPTCATKRPSPKRQVLKERNLLLGSFDETSNLEREGIVTVTEEVPKTLLDDDSIPLPDEPIDLSKCIIPPQPPRPATPVERPLDAIVSEFEKDEEDLEFEELAAESLAKGGSNVVQDLNIGFVVQGDQWDAKFDSSLNEEPKSVEHDPFDTTFAEPILPDERLAKIKPVSNLLINQDRIPEQELNLIKPTDRDLLGGSNVDLSIGARFTQIEPADPFEIIDTKTSLDLDDDDFDPRAIEKPRERTVSRPDVLNIIGSKTVSFDVPSPDSLLKAESSRVIKPLTPFYTRKNSVPELPDAEEDDPFDTSFAVNLAPGKAELKVIESELFDPNIEKSFSLEDKNFDPRDERRAKIDRVLNSVNEVVKVESLSRSVDLLDIDDDISVKVLTPADFGNEVEELSYRDPFDTSAISTNILPGKTELKLLESELIFSDITQVQSVERNQCVDNLLSTGDDLVIEQPLNPVEGFQSIQNQEDFDPFDTSCVADIQPANPFLFSEEAYTSPSSASSNPFLMGDDDDGDVTPQNENPFLSQTATAAVSTNPFSFDPTEPEPAEAEIPQEDPFGNFSNNTDNITDSPFDQPAEPMVPKIESSSISPQKPSDLNLKYTNAGFNNLPPRPPPPRPPPSKETQDLLMSVMGAMDATSSTLLDKIPPTRTPSPVSMRDLHSQCPTPEPPFGDLLDVGDKPDNTNFNDQDLVTLEQDNVCDINQNPAVNLVESNGKPPRPTPPARPPKPPLPPALLNNVTKEATLNNVTPAQPPPPPAAQQNTNNVNIVDEMDMFGIEDRPQKPVTKADILNLYNTPKQETVKDLLCDNDETDLILQNTETVSTVANETTIDKTRSPSPSKEKISPLNDSKTPLSESHSKESVSTTVNPFATPGDVTPQQPVVSQELFESEAETINQDKAMDIFNTTVDDTKTNVFAQESFGVEKPAESMNQNAFGVAADDTFGAPAEDTFRAPAAAPAVPIGDAFGVPAAAADAFGAPAAAEDAFGVPTAASLIPTKDSFGVSAATAETAFSVNTTPIVQDAFANSVPVIEDPFGFSGGASTKGDDFDEFSKKFDSVKTEASKFGDAWGNDAPSGTGEVSSGFGQEEGFDAFLALQEPPCVPQSTPNRVSKAASQESDEDKDFSVFIRPKGTDELDSGILPTIAPPPVPQQLAFVDTSPRFNPFDNQTDVSNAFVENDVPFVGEMTRTDSQETPPTPLFDDDVSQPLEPFPRTIYTGEGWEMHLRQPNKKKITGQRFWKKIFVKLLHQTDCVLLQLFNQKDDKDPFQELPLQPCYSVSDIGAQQYDQFGKIFTVKLQYIFYKERPGVRPGQVKKAERITNKLSQFAAYAIQGDYQGVKEFGSDLKKLGLPVEHAPQVSQLMKLGSLNFEDLKQFSMCIEESLFRLQAHRDRALHYKMEEVQITAVDELYVEQDAEGHVEKQIARVRLFFLGFLTGMPDVELGVNDMRRQGKEVVGRHDIIPVVTEEWIRLENVEFHSCIQQEDYNNTHIIKFKPPDACYIELMRFRVRPPKNRELPLQLKAQICITGYKVELRADVLVPGFTSRKLGQVPCEDVMIRFPIPECWIYLFRVEKHFRYGSVKSAHRRTGKVKGIERILGAMETLQENLIEVTSGQAKYEHQHRAIVWRCPRLPKEGQGAYTTHNMVCRIALTNFDQMPDKLAEYCYVEFTMPATQVSHTTCRSVSMQNSDSDEPPEKYVRYLARHEYRVGIERTQGESPNAYSAATFVTKSAPPPPAPVENTTPKVVEESSSDSDD